MFVSQRYIGPEGSGRKENEFFNQTGPKKFTRQNWKKLSLEDRKRMMTRIEEAREKLREAFQSMPNELLFVLR